MGGSERFPRSARLADGRAFERVFAHAIRSRDAGFTVLARCNGGIEGRLGLAVSKRQIRSAARRNRVKRRIRESFRRARGRLGGLDVVVLTKRGVDDWDSGCTYAALDRHWSTVSERCAKRPS